MARSYSNAGRSQSILVRVTPEEKKRYETAAVIHGISLSEVMRQGGDEIHARIFRSESDQNEVDLLTEFKMISARVEEHMRKQ